MTLIPSDAAGKKYERRDLEISAITRSLKNLSSEIRVPIIALSQLNRAKDDTDEPSLRCLRESGGIEQDASKVIFLWNINAEANEIGVKISKNRRGKTGIVKMKFSGEYMRFIELSEKYVSQAKKPNAYNEVFGDD